MFFPMLRKRAKWVFVLLALAFGIGFIGFGVGGQGGGGIADVIGGIFGREGSAQTSVSEAQEKLADNPDDPEARLDLAQALTAEQRFDEARPAYESYLELEPSNTQALQELALLQQAYVGEALQRGQLLQLDASAANPGAEVTFDPNSSPFTRALAENELTGAIAASISAEAEVAFAEATERAGAWVITIERLTVLSPNSPTLQLQLAQAAEQAGDEDTAIAAYLRALELDPAGPAAVQVRDRVVLLGGQVPDDLNQLIDERAAQLDPDVPIFEQQVEDSESDGGG